jgi:hypothetical protein
MMMKKKKSLTRKESSKKSIKMNEAHNLTLSGSHRNNTVGTHPSAKNVGNGASKVVNGITIPMISFDHDTIQREINRYDMKSS